ncbi:MAG TPA: hypothetical protein GXX36_14010, partial [Clostridiaceae bacterium]|nr:hypothetical protein [Clostridiaceae bacterium]
FVPCSMPLATAQKILNYGKEGLPVIIVGNAPESVGSFMGDINDMNEADAELKSIMDQLAELPTTRVVSSKDEVPKALEELGVYPDMRKDASSALLGFHRTDENVEYYYLYNSDLNRTLSQTVYLKGEGVPFLLNPWNGDITPIAQYEQKDGRISLDVSIAPNDFMLIAIAQTGWTGGKVPKISVVSSNADEVVYDDDGNIAVRTQLKGEYTLNLSNGQSVIVKVEDDAEEERTIDNWTMVLESWKASSNPLETVKTKLEPISMDTLVPWNEIEGLEDVAGVATYTAKFTLENGWDKGHGALLSFDRVSDTMKLKVNGQPVEVNQLSNCVDIGKYVVSGENLIEIEVTSNLANIKSSYTQEFGLIGNVTLKPYVQTVARDIFAIPPFDVETVFTVGKTANADKLEANAMLDASAVITNNETESRQVLLIVALYDSNNRMVNVSYLAKEVAAGTAENFHAGFKLPSDVTGYKVKAFVWEGESLSSSNLKPVSNVVEITD